MLSHCSFGHSNKVPHDCLKNILKEIAPGVTFDLSESQLDEIIKALSSNCVCIIINNPYWLKSTFMKFYYVFRIMKFDSSNLHQVTLQQFV